MPAMNLMADDVTQSTIFCVVKFVIVLPTLQGHKTGPGVCMRPAIIRSNTVTILVTCLYRSYNIVFVHNHHDYILITFVACLMNGLGLQSNQNIWSKVVKLASYVV